MLTTFLRLLFLGIAAALLLAACGNDDASKDGSEPAAPAADDTGEQGGDRAIEGPLVFVSGLGLYAAAADGSGNRIDFVDVDNAAIGIAPAIDKGSDVAYVFTYAAMEDESFSNHVFLSRLDLGTGENERFAELGYDLESDESEELFQYREIAVAGDPQSNGAILRIDGNGLTAELVHEPCTSDYLCDGQAAIVFNRTAPGQLWMMFARMEDRGGGSRVGEIFVQRLDETTGEAMLEVSVLELAGIR